MKGDKKMMVMEVKIAALSKLAAKVVPDESDCFCANNNNIGDHVSKVNTSSSSGKFEMSRKRNSVGEGKPKKLEIRKEEVMAIRTRFPNKIPVIVQKYWKDNQLPQLDKSKFLVPQDITMSQFQTIIRNRMRMNQNQALYLLVNERSMLSLSLTLGEIYTDHAGPNGFLYITYASQEVFGNDTDEFRSEKKFEETQKFTESIQEMTANLYTQCRPAIINKYLCFDGLS